MTNFIEKLKQVAAGRTKGEWTRTKSPHGFALGMFYGDKQLGHAEDPDDAQFIALAANCFDELVAVAEAAMDTDIYSRHAEHCRHEYRKCTCGKFELDTAVEALRQKVEGECS